MFMIHSQRKFSHDSHVIILYFIESLLQIKENFAQVRSCMLVAACNGQRRVVVFAICSLSFPQQQSCIFHLYFLAPFHCHKEALRYSTKIPARGRGSGGVGYELVIGGTIGQVLVEQTDTSTTTTTTTHRLKVSCTSSAVQRTSAVLLSGWIVSAHFPQNLTFARLSHFQDGSSSAGLWALGTEWCVDHQNHYCAPGRDLRLAFTMMLMLVGGADYDTLYTNCWWWC